MRFHNLLMNGYTWDDDHYLFLNKNSDWEFKRPCGLRTCTIPDLIECYDKEYVLDILEMILEKEDIRYKDRYVINKIIEEIYDYYW